MTEGQASITTTGREGNNLLLRIVAALVMAPLAIAMAYVGGWLWTGLVTAAAIGLYVEWLTVIGARKLRLVIVGVLILLAVGWVDLGHINEDLSFSAGCARCPCRCVSCLPIAASGPRLD